MLVQISRECVTMNQIPYIAKKINNMEKIHQMVPSSSKRMADQCFPLDDYNPSKFTKAQVSIDVSDIEVSDDEYGIDCLRFLSLKSKTGCDL